MRQQIAKRNILIALYEDKAIPTNNLDLYSHYLKYQKGIEIGPQYLYRVLRELITARLVERIAMGTQKRECVQYNYENKHRRKIKNIYRLTHYGQIYVETEYLYVSGTSEGTESKQQGKYEEYINEMQELEDTNEGFLRSEGQRLTKKNYFLEERYVRLLKTKIFSEVCAAEKNIEYIGIQTLRSKITDKGTLQSRLCGLLKVVQSEAENVIPVTCVGGCVVKQKGTTEIKMRSEINRIYKTRINEEIILGENYEVLKQYIYAKNEKSPLYNYQLITDGDGVYNPIKYYHPINLCGVAQTKNYETPYEYRNEYFYTRLCEMGICREYFTKEGIKNAKRSSVFSSITSEADIYIGYEMNIQELTTLYKIMYPEKSTEVISNKKLIIVCQKDQEEFYKEMFKDNEANSTVKEIDIITTKEFI